ncbi:response regulator [Paenibacillus sedimenti]|uniref:Response regulator transcription factor n=1 Tax=Paenibacillus sedimenti TaxID=2770274 RepID=A0A926KPD6_9BACL|nr:response regulator [Paenibacillus sedimenti]MBD0380853.1 response regulator transcription factor [Paenibacillus sedimenti]
MLKVMLVDDELYVRKGLLGLIDWESLGFRVCSEADNGKDALRLIEFEQPDVVITDIRMPVLDGLQLIEEVKRRRISACKFIVLSGYNDFSYAQSAIRFGVSDYILKPIEEEELEAILRRLAQQIGEELGQQLVRGRLTIQGVFEQLSRGDQVPKTLEELSAQVRVTKGTIFRYGIVEINRSFTIEKESAISPPGDVLNIVIDAFQTLTGTPNEFVVQLRKHQFAFLIGSDRLQPFCGSIERFAEALQGLLARRLQDEVTLYIGKGVKEIKALVESVQTTQEALQYKYVPSLKGLLLYESIQKVALSYSEPDASLFHAIKEAVEEQEMERLGASIITLFGEIAAKSMGRDAIGTIINRYVHAIIGVLQQMQGQTELLTTLKPMLGWDQLSLSFRDLQLLFTSFMAESARMIEQLRGEQTKGSIHKIKCYIEYHYQENINLKSIAAEFFMNPVYVGQLFKKKYGVYFNEFLLSIRIGEAKKLLRQTDLRIYEIAEKVGFNNADYFVAQFEKIEGMPPSEYRKKLLTKRGEYSHETTILSPS